VTERFFHPDLVRLAFVLGIVASILIYERRQVTTGGIAVPGYLAFAVFLPALAPAVIAIALATHALVHHGLARLAPIGQAAQFSLVIVVSAALHLAVDLGALILLRDVPAAPLLRGIGYVVPGLIAHDMARHGIGRSLGTIGLASALVAAVLVAIVLMLPETGRLMPSPVEAPVPIDLDWVPVVVVFSLIAWFGLTRLNGLRCGGFLGGAYLTLLVAQPAELAAFAVLAAVTVALTKTVLEPTMILFGRRKFAAVLMLGGSLSWLLHKGREALLGGGTISVATPSLAVVGVLLTGLLVSDIDRVGLGRTALGLAANVAFTLTGTLLVAETLLYGRIDIALALVLVLAGLTLLTLATGRAGRRDPAAAAR
jgi:hypothetical protein